MELTNPLNNFVLPQLNDMLNEMLVNFESVGIFIGIIVITIIFGYLFSKLYGKYILNSLDIVQRDPTSYRFLKHAIMVIIYLVGISIAIYVLPNLRALASSLLAGAGILAVAVGFASQHALSNIISGLFLIIFKPFKIDQRIEYKDKTGIVEDITLRHVVVRDFSNRRVIIPNAIISDEVIINSDFVDQRSCQWIDFNISFDSSIDQARTIMKDEMMNHPLFIDHRTEKEREDGKELAPVNVIEVKDYAIKIRGWAWAENSGDGFTMYCELLESIIKRFDKEGITIPYPFPMPK